MEIVGIENNDDRLMGNSRLTEASARAEAQWCVM